ncbi:helix-turn-helix domain-containing protein [Variovorax sp. E3]|uniref:helix-turn-helix domain-containing protein n=1 Tax=Variovorax sp. E3 TaxID=1914993 RepID=UPI0018DCA7DF|nr:helix-turn-helix transcriptional regulator [Variovorax sp. E3]
MDFEFSIAEEVCAELGARIRAQRLMQGISQRDLAQRAGVSYGTVRHIETTGQASMDSFIRVVHSLGLIGELQSLFKLNVRSIADMESAQGPSRKRAPRRPRP